MKHYHLQFFREDKQVVAQVRYENIDDAVISFIDMCYYIFPDKIDEMFKSEYIGKVFGMLDSEEDSIVLIPTQKLSLGVMRCPYETCSSATDN